MSLATPKMSFWRHFNSKKWSTDRPRRFLLLKCLQKTFGHSKNVFYVTFSETFLKAKMKMKVGKCLFAVKMSPKRHLPTGQRHFWRHFKQQKCLWPLQKCLFWRHFKSKRWSTDRPRRFLLSKYLQKDIFGVAKDIFAVKMSPKMSFGRFGNVFLETF